ncbi:MAG: YafY family protein [Planctomycetota bacterium]
MRRADRLFQLIEILRRRDLVTAQELSEELEVSVRTVYRDVQDLVGSGVPVEGEAGVGYTLKEFDLPPVMLDRDEIEALSFGMRVASTFGDPELSKAAKRVIAKIEVVLPDERRHFIEGTRLLAPQFGPEPAGGAEIRDLRRALRERRLVELEYVDASRNVTARRVRPLGMAFLGYRWLLIAWCELREDFRTFRPDRIESLLVLDETFEHDPERDVERYLAGLKCGSENAW